MARTFRRDTTKSIQAVVQALIKENREFEFLRDLEFIYTYRLHKPAYVRGDMVEAQVKLCSGGERDKYEKDVEVCVFEDAWNLKLPHQREQLLYGQLLRIDVALDEQTMEPALDDDGRMKLALREPSIRISVFEEEIVRYGVPPELAAALDKLTRLRMRRGKGDNGGQ
jgi:hypothetical protein